MSSPFSKFSFVFSHTDNSDAEQIQITNTQGQGTSAILLDANAGGVTLTGAAASNFTTSSGALTLTGADASTWKTTGGALTLDGAAGIVIDGNTTGIDMTTSGPIKINNAAGTSGQVLTSQGGSAAPQWQSPSSLSFAAYAGATSGWSGQTIAGSDYYEPLAIDSCDVSGSPSMFSTADGQFIAPVNGIYFFSASLCMQRNATTAGGVIFFLEKRTNAGTAGGSGNIQNPPDATTPKAVTSPGSFATGEQLNFAFSGLLNLTANDRVGISIAGASDGEQFSVDYITFSGFKIN